VLQGRWTPGNVWGGVRQAMVRAGDFGTKVPKAVQQEVLARQGDIGRGKLHPFAGPISTNEGKLVLPGGRTLTDEQILGMDYLVAGVQGKISK
jgi:simple sugar transport system substrate-binding protein